MTNVVASLSYNIIPFVNQQPKMDNIAFSVKERNYTPNYIAYFEATQIEINSIKSCLKIIYSYKFWLKGIMLNIKVLNLER